MWLEIHFLVGLSHPGVTRSSMSISSFSLSTLIGHQFSGLCSNIRHGGCLRFIIVFQDFGYAAFPFAISPGRRFDTVPRITRAESSATVLDLQKLHCFAKSLQNLVYPICSKVLHGFAWPGSETLAFSSLKRKFTVFFGALHAQDLQFVTSDLVKL